MYKDITGKKFGRLLALERVGKTKHGHSIWRCLCDCGNIKDVSINSLTMGVTKSCGCLNMEVLHRTGKDKPRATHGMCGTRIYRIWKGMKNRCSNGNTQDYATYGERGITVCDEWENDFSNFYEWATQNGYESSKSIDRIDNDLGYSPANCRWATDAEQANNKSTNLHITWNGVTHTPSQWSEITGIDPATIRRRYHEGWESEDIFTIPKGGRRRSKHRMVLGESEN